MDKKYLISKIFVVAFIPLVIVGLVLIALLNDPKKNSNGVFDLKPKLNLNVPETKLKVEAETTWNEILKDSAYEGTGNIKLLDGSEVSRDGIGNIIVIYTQTPQAYLHQASGPGELVFASVGINYKDGTLTFHVHISPDKLKDLNDEDKDWWITHQVIRALNKMTHPELNDDQLVPLDREMFQKYKGKVIWSN